MKKEKPSHDICMRIADIRAGFGKKKTPITKDGILKLRVVLLPPSNNLRPVFVDENIWSCDQNSIGRI